MTKIKIKRQNLNRMIDRIVIIIYGIVWRRRLTDGKENMTIVKVKGWRTAIIESNRKSRHTITHCFKLFGIEFD